MKVKFTYSIDDELLAKVKIQAIKEKRSVSDIITELLEKYFNELEDN